MWNEDGDEVVEGEDDEDGEGEDDNDGKHDDKDGDVYTRTLSKATQESWNCLGTVSPVWFH